MKKFYLLALAVLGLSLTGAASALNLDFTLENNTGHTITGLYISPHGSDQWGGNWLSGALRSTQEANVEFLPGETDVFWDIKAEYANGSIVTFTEGYNLAAIYYVRLSYYRDGTPKISYTYSTR